MTLFRFRSAAVIVLTMLFAQTATAMVAPLQDATRLLKNGKREQALEIVDKFLNEKPQDAQGRFLKGLILSEMNRNADAVVVFRKLSEDYPTLPEPYNNLAVIYAQQQQYDKAKEALEMAIRTHPAYATAHENLGDIYARMASQAYDKALQIDSANTRAQTKLAMIRELVGVRAPSIGTVASSDSSKVPLTPVTENKPPVKPEPSKPEPKPELKPEPKPTPKPETKPELKPLPPAEIPRDHKPESKPSVTGSDLAVVGATANEWAAAWSRKDVKSYLEHYAQDFELPGGQSRNSWEKMRASRINKPGAISVELEDLTVNLDSPDRATVRFKQHYRSAGFNASSPKTLIMKRVSGKWLIQKELVGQ